MSAQKAVVECKTDTPDGVPPEELDEITTSEEVDEGATTAEDASSTNDTSTDNVTE